MSRTKAAEIARATLAAIEAGGYTNSAGQWLDLTEPTRFAVENTVSYPAEAEPPAVAWDNVETRREVVNESALVSIRRMCQTPGDIACLNFASAKNPGGGFLGGAIAQEEVLARSSGLYPCIKDNPVYEFHRKKGGAFYTNSAIYSPAVPFFRTDEGAWLDTLNIVSIITSPAVNAGASRYLTEPVIRREMRDRVEKVLSIAIGHGCRRLILGAWGCGVFGNDPVMIAELFRDALGGRFFGAFSEVIFAVLDREDGPNISAFVDALG